jgi:hypothetical protein
MAAREFGLETLAEVLLQQGFYKTDEFGRFMTYERASDSSKIHVGFDGSFAAFDSDDELVTEGKGMQELYATLVSTPVVAGSASASPSARSRRTKAA